MIFYLNTYIIRRLSEEKMVKNDTVEIFHACDEGFMKYLAVSLSSLIRHRDAKRDYNIHILCTSVGEDMAVILR